MTEWTVIAPESPQRIILDTIGDEFTGVFQGFDHVKTDDGQYDFEQAVFIAQWNTDPSINNGELYAIGGYKVLQALHAATPIQKMVRLRYVKDLPMSGNNRNPMKDITVEVASS